MTFFPQDLYLSSGLGTIQNSWTSLVSKFDTSTFYNWEQDNEPLYDLDERTSYIWEKIGYPVQNGFSGIPGKMFVVSGDAIFTGEYSSVNSIPVFKHVSSVISILPNPLTFPVIIEVATFGDLGDLRLHNLKIDPNCAGAGLEIINRNFGRSTSISGTVYTSVSSITSPDIVGTLHQSSSMALGVAIASGFYDQRWNLHNKSWLTRSPDGSSTNVITNDLFLSVNAQNFDLESASDRLILKQYDSSIDPSITGYDISVVRTVDSTVLTRTALAAGNSLHSLVYGNSFSRVSIKNCAGPIYIRGFAVDGASGTGGSLLHSTSAGFEVYNSTILFENCIAIRCSSDGFKIVDSEIELSRSIGAGRNYDFVGGLSNLRDTTKGVGIYALNSNLKIRPDAYANGSKCVIQTARNSTGIELINSRLGEGTAYDGTLPTSRTYIQSFFNTGAGIDLKNSVLDHKGHLEVYNNAVGLKASNSKIFLPTIVAEFNQTAGVDISNTLLEYNPFLVDYNHSSSYYTGYQAIYFNSNGQHIVCDNSQIIPTYSTSMPTKYGLAHFVDSFGLSKSSGGTQLPSIEIMNGSKVDLVHPVCRAYTNFVSNRPVFGACVSVKNNSLFKSSSSRYGGGIFVGPPNYANQQYLSVLNADSNSIIELAGPTFVGQGGVDVLVENNSIVKLLPHNKGGDLDIDGWTLSDSYNHSRIELHSTRACLVADNNSTIQMADLGNYSTFWGALSANSNDFNDTNALSLNLYTSAGYCQFYPNGQDSTTITTRHTDDLSYASSPFSPLTLVYNSVGHFITEYTSASIKGDLSSVSTGGMCVKAVGGSLVKVVNVHFPAGWYNTSGYWYDIASVNCDQLRIWNIADTSRLDAAYCTVSGTYPSLAGYYGPSSVYVSAGGAVANGVPSLPDTGTLSVLDQYGSRGGVVGTNYGPFRLYLSPSTKAKMFCDATSFAFGPPYQLWAQGYNVSGNVSSTTSFSGVYSGINASQFIHVSSILDPSFKDRIRLDESAANTFANARHCASTKSGRNAVVTIYRAGTGLGGIASDGGVANMGKGFKSADIFDLRRNN